MPGHKGAEYVGCEALDITEVSGADSLYEAEGIIAQSELNASGLFGCPTYYSTEGSSQAIRAMLYLCLTNAKENGRAPLVLAGRNAHKAFVSAAALLDLNVDWIYPNPTDSYLACTVTARDLDKMLAAYAAPPAAVYVTTPDYLGNMVDLKALAEVCHRHNTLLAVDNAHGAYLRFLTPSQHPMDMGADVCCDSAHKTLPVLTGGAYLHISTELKSLAAQAKNALALFGSTSPSYLILQSLDMANKILSEGYAQRLRDKTSEVDSLKSTLQKGGFTLIGNESMKISISAKHYGYEGTALAALLAKDGIECEFADSDYLVLMPSADSSTADLNKLQTTLLSIPMQTPLSSDAPTFVKPAKALSIREAALSPSEALPLKKCIGRVLAQTSVACPPAVPILVSGEIIDQNAIDRFNYYKVKTLTVVK